MKTEDIDRQIGMPDVEAEWTKFKRDVIGKTSKQQPRGQRWMSRAAVIALVCSLGLVVLASTVVVNWTDSHSADHAMESADQSEEAVPDSLSAETQIAVQEQTEDLVFDNVEMQEVARRLEQRYGVRAVFVHEETRHVRLYASLGKDLEIEEVVAFMNNFEKVHLVLDGERLVIE